MAFCVCLLSLSQQAVFDWNLLCLTSGFFVPILPIVKRTVLLVDWGRERFCARERQREDDGLSVYFWGATRLGLCEGGVSVPQYLPEVHSEGSFCFLEHPHMPGTV